MLRPSAKCCVGTSADHLARIGLRTCPRRALRRTPAAGGTRWKQSGCKANEYQYSCVLQFRGARTQKISPESQLAEFSRQRGGRSSRARLRLDRLCQYFCGQPLSAARQRGLRCSFDEASGECRGPQRAAGRRQHPNGLARTAAADFRTRNHPVRSLGFVR